MLVGLSAGGRLTGFSEKSTVEEIAIRKDSLCSYILTTWQVFSTISAMLCHIGSLMI
jgi:hypothetical protein